MSEIRKILEKEMEKSGGSARLVKVPEKMRPDAESLKKLSEEIEVQVERNRK